MKGVNHYKKDGSVHKGQMHKMSNGSVHTGKAHTKNSKALFHYGELNNKSKAKAKASWGKK